MHDSVGIAVPNWGHLHEGREGNLRIEPLHPVHAEGWLNACRDGTIAARTRLPQFHSRDQVEPWLKHCWLATLQPVRDERAQCFSFAVVHAERGFIGAIRMHRFNGRAMFSIWIGPEHQGLGFGTRSTQLAADVWLPPLNIAELFAAVYSDNQRSLVLLARCGWSPLNCFAESKARDLLFLRWSAPQYARSANRRAEIPRLTRLLQGLGSDITLNQTVSARDSRPFAPVTVP